MFRPQKSVASLGRRRIVQGLLSLLMVPWPMVGSAATPFTQIVAFGDSLTDAGNLKIVYPSAFGPSGPYYLSYEGRFSNGPNWLDQLAAKLGVIDPQPSLAGGTNYAYGGASADAAYQTPGLNVPYLGQQVQSYLQTSPAADPNALYVVWMGNNDVFNDGLTNPAVPGVAAADVAASIASLITAGRNIFSCPTFRREEFCRGFRSMVQQRSRR